MNADLPSRNPHNCLRALRVLAGLGTVEPLDDPTARALLADAEQLLLDADRQVLMQGLRLWIRSNTTRIDPRNLNFQIRL